MFEATGAGGNYRYNHSVCWRDWRAPAAQGCTSQITTNTLSHPVSTVTAGQQRRAGNAGAMPGC